MDKVKVNLNISPELIELSKEPPLLTMAKAAHLRTMFEYMDNLILGVHNPETCGHCKLEKAFQEFSKDWPEDDPGDECDCEECKRKKDEN